MVAEGYLFATVEVIEQAYADTVESSNPAYCTIPNSCECEGCLKSRHPTWGCDVAIDFTEANVVLGCSERARRLTNRRITCAHFKSYEIFSTEKNAPEISTKIVICFYMRRRVMEFN